MEEKVTEVKGGYALFIYSKNCIGYPSIKLTQLVDSQFYVLFMITEVIMFIIFKMENKKGKDKHSTTQK